MRGRGIDGDGDRTGGTGNREEDPAGRHVDQGLAFAGARRVARCG
jgi:hypothetical protein